MDTNTRHAYLTFLDQISTCRFRDVEDPRLNQIEESAKELLAGTDLYRFSMQKVLTCRRFLASAENGAAEFEMNLLVSELRNRLS